MVTTEATRAHPYSSHSSLLPDSGTSHGPTSLGLPGASGMGIPPPEMCMGGCFWAGEGLALHCLLPPQWAGSAQEWLEPHGPVPSAVGSGWTEGSSKPEWTLRWSVIVSSHLQAGGAVLPTAVGSEGCPWKLLCCCSHNLPWLIWKKNNVISLCVCVCVSICVLLSSFPTFPHQNLFWIS